VKNSTHTVLTFTLVSLAWNPHLAPLASLGSLLPDLDHPDSLPSTPLRVILGRERTRKISEFLGGHRGALHYPYPWAILAITAWATGHPWIAALFIGALLHVIEDSMTTMGVPVAKGKRIALTAIPSERWDKIALPAILILLPCAWLAAPTTFPDPTWRGYWSTRCEINTIFIHTSDRWNAEARRMTEYGYLPAGEWIIENNLHIHGILTPHGWLITRSGNWIRLKGNVTGQHVYPAQTRIKEKTTYSTPPKHSLILNGLIITKENFNPIPALTRGLRIIYRNRNETVLECDGITWKILNKSIPKTKVKWESLHFVALS